ncbi:MAG TPA: GntR family transcriptional regulator [Methylomirabilota bacterium]|nr:GntR family transcriptional regulator [Methylomirabilota bacterium]
MQIHITSDDGVPIYIQIVNQVKHLVASGRLTPGDEMPPIRALAEQLVVNPNTVARAYLELERGGIVTKRHGAGTYVSEERSPIGPREKLKILTSRVDSLLTEARHLNVELADIIKLIRDRDVVMEKEKV